MIGRRLSRPSTATPRSGPHRDENVRADGLGHEAGVPARAVARPFDLEDDGLVQQAAEECGGEDWIAEHLNSLGRAAVRGQDCRALSSRAFTNWKIRLPMLGADRRCRPGAGHGTAGILDAFAH